MACPYGRIRPPDCTNLAAFPAQGACVVGGAGDAVSVGRTIGSGVVGRPFITGNCLRSPSTVICSSETQPVGESSPIASQVRSAFVAKMWTQTWYPSEPRILL